MTDRLWVAGAATFCGVAGLLHVARGVAGRLGQLLDLDRRDMAATYSLRPYTPDEEVPE